MKTILLFAACLIPALGLRAADHKLSGENTTIKFVGSKKDGKHEGTFTKLEGTLSLDAADMAKSKLEVAIEINSMTTDAEKLTAHLKSPDFFDAKRHPQAKFVSTSIKADPSAKDAYVVTGDLTLHGKTHPVSFPAKTSTADGVTTVSCAFEINRHDWGISYSRGKVDDAVKMSIDVKLKKK
jgi:polyisoprenoid-binding protein YceI